MKGIQTKQRLALMTGLLLASCAHHRTNVAVETPTAPSAAPRPVLAPQFAAVVPPAKATDGRYRTINYGIDPVQTEWHVRAALNVAAIGCRGAADGALVTAYNTMLTRQKTVLAAANSAVEAKFRAAGGNWQSAHDAYMTRLYNFFSQPAAKSEFCAVADRIAPEAATPPDGFENFATTALPKLEAPFLETYRQVDDYKLALADWQAGRTRMARATPIERKDATPRLAYADMRALLSWQPSEGVRYASR
jgi:hypothetical protein